MAHEVFIAYATTDKKIADAICKLLEDKGIPCWIAPRDSHGQFGGVIVDAVEQSKVLVFVFSKHSNASRNCLTECATAFQNNMSVIALRIDDTELSKDFRYYLQVFDWIDAQELPIEQHYETLFNKVAKELADITARAEAERKEKERLEAEAARAKGETEAAEIARKRREAEEARAKEEAEAAEAAKIRREAEQARAKEAEAARKRREAEEDRARKEAEAAKQSVVLKPTKARTIWLLLGIIVVAIAVIGVALRFTVFSTAPTNPEDGKETVIATANTSDNATTTTTPPTVTENATTPPPPPPPPSPYGTITIATTDFGNESVDPTYFDSLWGFAMYDTLITYNETGYYTGEVAESWSIAEDGITWTFNIRQGIKFHNGDPLTANDVLFTLERFTSENSSNPWSPSIRNNKASMKVVDDYTFEFITLTPELPLVDVFSQVRIIPKDYFESVGEEQFILHPVGSGPWKFVEHIPGTSFKMEANTDYWGEVPAFQYIVDLLVPDEATQIAMLKRSEIDIPRGLTTDKLVQLETEGWQTRVQGLATPTVLNFIAPYYETAGPVHDIRIRKALSYAINREEMCATYWKGNAEPGGRFFLIPGGYGVTDDLIAPDPYNPDLARSLMAEAGYPHAWNDPVIHCFTTEGTGVDFFLTLQGYWNEVGLQVQIEVVESNVWLSYFFMPQGIDVDAPNVGWIWTWTGGAFNGTYYSRNMYTSYGIHCVTNDPVVDSIWDEYIAETDLVRARGLYTEFQRVAKALYTSFGIAYTIPRFIVSSYIGEFTGNTYLTIYDALAGVQHPD